MLSTIVKFLSNGSIALSQGITLHGLISESTEVSKMQHFIFVAPMSFEDWVVVWLWMVNVELEWFSWVLIMLCPLLVMCDLAIDFDRVACDYHDPCHRVTPIVLCKTWYCMVAVTYEGQGWLWVWVFANDRCHFATLSLIGWILILKWSLQELIQCRVDKTVIVLLISSQ